MGFFGKSKSTSFLTEAEQKMVVDAIQEAEQSTSGEIRVFIEKKCAYPDPMDRAKEVFYHLKMDATDLKNGVLVYLAHEDHRFCLLGDKGIHEKTGDDYWQQEVEVAITHFKQKKYAHGLKTIILDIGLSLSAHFPYDSKTDKNELPDEIVFGND